MQKLILRKEPNYTQKKTAFDFQMRAEIFAENLEYCGIFHEQGLGKTKIALDLSLKWFLKREIDTVLIVTKKSLISNWINEVTEHTFLKPKIISQNLLQNSYIFNSPTRMIICHYEVFPNEVERIKLFCKSRNVAIILDEATKIKNPDSQISKSFIDLSKYFTKRIIMTGTPVANRPFDIWALIFFLDNGKSLGNNFNDFKKDTDLNNELYNNRDQQNRYEDTLKSIYTKISSFCIRETKLGSNIELPKKNYIKVDCDWEYNQRDMYEQIVNEMRLVVQKNGKLEFDDSSVVLKRILRLIQVTSNPTLIDSNYKNEPGKITNLIYLVDEIIQKNEKVIIWTNFIENVNYLYHILSEFKPLRVYGKLSIDDRNEAIYKFKNDESRKILIATPASAKEGLTLTVANHAIFLDRNLSLDDYLQSQDRIHRISQKKECYIYDFIMKDSIDEWVDALIESKHYSAKLLQNDISLDEYNKNVNYDYSLIFKNILNGGNNE